MVSLNDLSIGKFIRLSKEKTAKKNLPTEKKSLYVNAAVTAIVSGVAFIEPQQEQKTKKKFWYHNNWNEGIRHIGATANFYRSKWEANYARYLEVLKTKKIIRDWQFEVDKFYFEGIKGKQAVKAYIPDFKVFYADGTFEYHEVKGYMDSKAKTKIKRFAEYYPEFSVKIIDAEWFKQYKQLGRTIDGWEN